MILTKNINVIISGSNYKFYKKKYPDIKMFQKIKVNVNELPINSPLRIDCKCEICGEIKNIPYRKYLMNKDRQGYYSCKHCKNIKTFKTKEKLYKDGNYNNSESMIKTKQKNFTYIPYKSFKPFRLYVKFVNRFTYKNKGKLFKEWNGYDYYDNEFIKNNFELNFNDMKYPTIDHKISSFQGFIENIPPYIVGGFSNLCITKRELNLKKSKKTIFKQES